MAFSPTSFRAKHKWASFNWTVSHNKGSSVISKNARWISQT